MRNRKFIHGHYIVYHLNQSKKALPLAKPDFRKLLIQSESVVNEAWLSTLRVKVAFENIQLSVQAPPVDQLEAANLIEIVPIRYPDFSA